MAFHLDFTANIDELTAKVERLLVLAKELRAELSNLNSSQEIAIHVNTINAKSFAENSSLIADAVEHAIRSGHSGGLSNAINYMQGL